MTNAESIDEQRVWPLQTTTIWFVAVDCLSCRLLPNIRGLRLQQAQFLSLHPVQYYRTTNFEHTVTFDSIPSTRLIINKTALPQLPHHSSPASSDLGPASSVQPRLPPHSRSQLHSFLSFSVSALQYDWNAPVKLSPNHSARARDPFSLPFPGRTRRCGPISEI